MDRRLFLKKSLALGALALGGGSWLTACNQGVRRADLTPEERLDDAVPRLSRKRLAILNYASLAPSGHNSQPWLVRIVTRNEWIVGADPERRLPAVDPDNRELLLSLGAFVENLALSAGAMGFETGVEVIAKQASDREVLRIRLRRAAPRPYPLDRLTHRMTVKQGHRPEELKPGLVKALSAAADGRLYYFPRGGSHAKRLEESAVEAFRLQVARDEAQKELAAWVRIEDDEARRGRDGLTVASLEISGLVGWWMSNFTEPLDFLNDDFRKRSVEITARLAGQGAGWLVLTSPGSSPADLIEAGRRFERLALIAREHRLAIHPMTQCLEEEASRKHIAEKHRPDMLPQFLLRVGYLDRYPDPVSLRRPVSWFVL